MGTRLGFNVRVQNRTRSQAWRRCVMEATQFFFLTGPHPWHLHDLQLKQAVAPVFRLW